MNVVELIILVFGCMYRQVKGSI